MRRPCRQGGRLSVAVGGVEGRGTRRSSERLRKECPADVPERIKVYRCRLQRKTQRVLMEEGRFRECADTVRAGGLVVYPTETLYGLGADPFNEAAVKRVFMAKRRPFDMPLSVAVSDVRMFETLGVLNPAARRLIDRFLPGPLTILVTKKPSVPDILTSGTGQIGIRIPDHPFALKLIRAAGPIVATSANRHSHPDPVTCAMAKKDLGRAVGVYVDGGRTRLQAPSTIVDVSEGRVEIIRPGVVSADEIEAALHGRRR